MADFRDVSPQISEVAQNYHFRKTPQQILDLMSAVKSALRAIFEWLDKTLHLHLSSGASDSKSLSTLMQFFIYLAGSICVIALLIFVARHMLITSRRNNVLRKGASSVEELLNAEGWKSQAQRLAQARDYKQACRAVYLSLLQYLHEKEIAEFAPAKTNYEYAYLLSRYSQIQKQFRKLADLVELIWFGNREATKEDYDQALTWLRALEDEIRLAANARREELARSATY
jgi:hypothetical protein